MKNALVTGGSGGIGAAICRRLAADGCHVYIHAHRGVEAAQTLVDAICASGGSAQVLAFDVTDSAAVAAVLTPLTEHQPIQILVNNAGIHDDAVFPGMRAEQCTGDRRNRQRIFHVTQPLMMPMIRSRWGRIINVTSIAALTGNRGQVNYSAAKGALNSATKSLALEVASRASLSTRSRPALSIRR